MPYAVIMAGGQGERFWPKSRRALPKQFLSLLGKETMLQKTVARLTRFISWDKIYIITSAVYLDIVLEQVPEIPKDNIIAEPCGRDTAAAVGLASLVITRKDPQGVMIVLPADHYIADEERFCDVLKAGVAAAASGEHVITLGVVPTRPETGYGYIAKGELFDTISGVPAYKVEGFTEKPDQKRALEFLTKGGYLWNSGIFIWRVDLIRRLIQEHLPVLHSGLTKIDEVLNTGEYQEVLKEIYAGLPKISIDYGVMEKAKNVLVLPADFGWDDVGSWSALRSYKEKDGNGNVLEGKGVLVDTSNTFVSSTEKVVATLGVKDLVIVEAEDSILVCHQERAQDIKKLVRALEENGFHEIL